MEPKTGLFLISLINLTLSGILELSQPLLAAVTSEVTNYSFAPETEEEKKKRCAEANAKAYGDCCAQSGIDCNNPRDDRTCTLKGDNAEKACLANPSPAPKDLDQLAQ